LTRCDTNPYQIDAIDALLRSHGSISCMEERTQAQLVVGRFAQHRKALDDRFGKSLVKTWLRQGTIREAHWMGLLELSHELDAGLTPMDFVAHVVERFTRQQIQWRAATSGDSPASSAVPA
jgi:hypothetical protein